MASEREFSADELAQAGRTTVELIGDAVSSNAYERVSALVEQLHSEVCSMLYGYLSWPKCIARNVKSWRDEHYWQELDSRVRGLLSDGLPPARQSLQRWEDTKNTLLIAAENRDAKSTLNLSRQWHKESLTVHDSYMNYAAVLVSELARCFGPEAMQQVLTEIMNPEAMEMQPDMPFRQRVEILIKFTRLHLLPFRLVEDDEKITFIASPCPSGGRQVLAGLYEGENPGELITGRTPATYGSDELPAYCCHESALEAASIQRFGSPLFIVEPSARLGHLPCHVHIYKDPARIPDRYYQRLGLRKDDILIASN